MKNQKGFTLIEVLVAIILVGLAIAALVGGNGAFSQANAAANEISTAEFLTDQIRERIAATAYTNLFAFDNITYNPPRDAKGDVLSDFERFNQVIIVQNVSNTNFTQVAADNSSNFLRVTVKILMGTKELSSTSWIRAKY